jgi:hypothetical protein
MKPESKAMQVDTSPTVIEDYDATVLQVQKALCERLLSEVVRENHNEVLMREWLTSGRAERYRELVDSDPKMHALVEEYIENKSTYTLDKMLEIVDGGLKH